MPDRIIRPPMVGVPCFSTIWRCGPSLRIGWPRPCFTLSSEMMRGPNRKMKSSAVRIAAPVRVVR